MTDTKIIMTDTKILICNHDNFVEESECMECLSLGIHTLLNEPKSHPRLCWTHEQILKQMNRHFYQTRQK
jgi:hypothetical protein